MKAPYPIEVTLFGITIELKDLQPEKVESPIEVTPFPIVTELNEVQVWKT